MSNSGGGRVAVGGVGAGDALVAIVAQSTGVSDAVANNSFGLLAGQDGSYSGYAVEPMLFNGATWDRPRTPAVFKASALVTAAGSTALWTPAAGKKFRLMGYHVQVAANAAQAVAGVLTLDLLDAAAGTGQTHTLFVPGAAGVAGPALRDTVVQLGNGILSGVANNVLNVNLSAALTAGGCRVLAWGTEE